MVFPWFWTNPEVSCDELFGVYDPEKLRRVPCGEHPRGASLVQLEGRSARVLERTKETLLVDLNHPLAGRRVNVTAP